MAAVFMYLLYLNMDYFSVARIVTSCMCTRQFFEYKCDLKLVFRFVLSGLLQVLNILITVFAPHFSSRAIKGLQRLSKIAVMEQAIVKGCN